MDLSSLSEGSGRSFLIEVQKGNIPGHSIVQMAGRNDAVPNGSWRSLAELNQTAATTHLSADTTVRVKAGGNAADTAAGAGAQAVTVVGIDDNLAEVSESIELAGASASSSTTTSFWRIYRAYITAARCGTYNAANTAAIVIENTAGTVDLLQIGVEDGESEGGAYTVPTGKTGYFLGAAFSVDSSKSANFRLFTRANFNDVSTPFEPIRLQKFFHGVVGEFNYSPAAPLILPALTDFWPEAYGDGAITEVALVFEVLLVDN